MIQTNGKLLIIAGRDAALVRNLLEASGRERRITSARVGDAAWAKWGADWFTFSSLRENYEAFHAPPHNVEDFMVKLPSKDAGITPGRFDVKAFDKGTRFGLTNSADKVHIELANGIQYRIEVGGISNMLSVTQIANPYRGQMQITCVSANKILLK